MLPETCEVPFGDLAALETSLQHQKLRRVLRRAAPGRRRHRLPPPGYLASRQALCAKYGALFVLDEVQTGMYRTGAFSPPITTTSSPTW